MSLLPETQIERNSKMATDTFIEYFIITDINATDGINNNIGADLFFKINRFYQNKCMEQESHTWKCRIMYNRLYIKKVYQNRILDISDQAVYYIDNALPNATIFQKKNINFLKRTVFREHKIVPDMLDMHPNELSEVNEICFQIDNLNTTETYYIHLRIFTNLYNSEKHYQVSYVTRSKEMFYMLLPFYLWEESDRRDQQHAPRKEHTHVPKKVDRHHQEITSREKSAKAGHHPK